MTTSNPHLNSFRQSLEGLRQTQRRLELFRRLILLVGIALVAISTAVIADVVFHFPTSLRLGTLTAFGLVALTALTVQVIAFARDPRVHPGLKTEEWWALKLGSASTDPARDRILNAFQINRTSPRERDNYSPDLAHEALLRAVAGLSPESVEGAIERQSLTNGLKFLLMSALAAAILLAPAPRRSLTALDRLLHPFRVVAEAAPFSFIVDPSGGWAYRNEPTQFHISIIGQAPLRCWFDYQCSGGETQSEELRPVHNTAIASFKGFTESITYRVRSGDVVTPEYRLNVVSRPQIVELQTRLTPPAYSGMPTVENTANIGDVEALPGSSLELKIKASKPLSRAVMVFLPEGADSSRSDTLQCEVSGKSAAVKRKLFTTGRYHLRLTDEDGHPDRDPVTYRIALLTDEYPQVRIVFPPSDVQLGGETALPLQIESDDDFGVSHVSLGWRRMEEDTVAHFQPLPLKAGVAPTVSLDYLWDLSRLTLAPGDVVEYWAVAWDNDNVNGPKSAESERRLLRLPTIDEIVADLEGTEKEGFEQVKEACENAQDLKEKIDRILDEIKRNPEMDWEKQQQMKDALDQQNAVQDQMKQLAQTLEQLSQKLDKYDMASQEVLEKYRQLQQLIAEVASPELKAAMEKLRQAIQNQDPEEIRKAMEEFQLNQESFLESIDRSMNILKQLQLERRLDALVKQAEELLHAQEDVVDRAKTDAPQDLAASEQSIAKQTGAFPQQIKETADLARENGEESTAALLDSLVQALTEQQLSAQMQQTASQFAQGNRQSGEQRSQQHARDLAQTLNQLTAMAKDLKERKKADVARKIRQSVEDLLYVSEEQESLIDEGRSLGTYSPRYSQLAGRQGDLQSALKNITNSVFNISKETFFITPDLGASLGKASEQMASAAERFSSRSPMMVGNYQQRALGEINSSARQLIDILGQLENSSSSTGYEEMMQRLSEMPQQQQGLNQQSLPLPGPGGQQQMPGGDQMSRLAAQQRALQEQMKQAAEDAEGMQDILGDLESIAQNMGDVAKDFEDQNVTERTRRLQRQIVSRLLDATRSARQEEYSKKRESKTGEDRARRSPEQLNRNAELEQLRRDLKRALQEGYTRDYRRLIRAYFQALEEGQKGEKK